MVAAFVVFKDSSQGLPRYTPQQLYDKVSVDNLYFIATGGGVCFGGGEPLLRVDFITEFKQLCGKSWNLTAETSLQVPRQSVEKATEVIGDFIVDIKEGNPDIYHAYTGGDASRAWDNLALLLSLVGPDHITVREIAGTGTLIHRLHRFQPSACSWLHLAAQYLCFFYS